MATFFFLSFAEEPILWLWWCVYSFAVVGVLLGAFAYSRFIEKTEKENEKEVDKTKI